MAFTRTYIVASKTATGSDQVQLGLAEDGATVGTAIGAMGFSLVMPAADATDMDVYARVEVRVAPAPAPAPAPA